MSKRNKQRANTTDTVEQVDNIVTPANDVPVIEAPKPKRIRKRQSVKLHNKKLSISVICSNPYLRQFS